ncbi:LysM peptidoglycan-binding domain-containing protein, partial [bacterium]|nr:LysM peptidoglycan-binding domain-containing protein [bacterium]
MKWLILIMLLAVLPSGPIFSQAKHVLKKDETLFRVSKIYNVSVHALMSVNYISDPRTLKEGMVLIIPERYIVRKGETLYGIA